MRALTSRTVVTAGVVLSSLAGLAGAAGAPPATQNAMASASNDRTYTGSRFILEIPSLGSSLGIRSIEGGYLVAELAPEPGPKGDMGKRVVGTRVAPLVIAANPGSIVPLLKAAIDGMPL